MKHHVIVAGGTADTETRMFLIMNRCRCPLVVCNYKFTNIGIFENCAVFLNIPL